MRGELSAPAFTLVEAAVSIVIVGVMFVAALTTVGAAAQGRRVQAEWRQADALGRSLLCEVARNQYGSTDGDIPTLVVVGGQAQDRRDWSTVDDFDGLDDCPPTDRTGSALADYSNNWRRRVSIERVSPTDPSGACTDKTDHGLKRIIVTVTAPSGRQTVVAALRSRWGWAEQSVPVDSAQVRAAIVHLRLSAGADVYAGAEMPNAAAVSIDPALAADPNKGEPVMLDLTGALQ